MTYSLSHLNQSSQDEFVTALGAIYEETPAIAQQVWHARPFASRADLHQKMIAIVEGLSPHAQLALIQAHPDLGSRARMADASVQEQASAGLDRLSPAEYEQFQTLNQAYQSKFGFPFIIAVKNQTKTSILAAFTQRLHQDRDRELHQALTEINQIARFRLHDLITEP